jgi:hypothetical protein
MFAVRWRPLMAPKCNTGICLPIVK